MATKSGMSLNPGADSTLVTAATRAALANVPRDLSGTFESVAKSYDATMKTVAQSYSEVAKKVVPLAANMVKNAIKESNIQTTAYGFRIEKPVAGPETEEQSKQSETEGAPGWSVTTDTSDDPSDTQAVTANTTIGDELRAIRKERRSLFFKNDRASKIK